MVNARTVDVRTSDRPTGTVTFLFTDIEGSSSMWENYPIEMQDALNRHDRIVRKAVEGNGGYVFKTLGDAFCAAFATAREALEATLEAQRALFFERWDKSAPVRVRMALHSGVAEERDGGYFGSAVNQVARLLSAGHGGQVLLSAATHGLVRNAPRFSELGVELRDLGEHRLKDIRYPERIFQLVVPDLPQKFPELKTLDTRSDERYTLKKLIGNGRMGEVYLTHDKELDRDVAFKVLKNQYVDDEQFVKRFESEARNAASLSHPNIVPVYHRGQTQDGAYYIAMEFVSGGTLEERILKEGPLPSGTAVTIALQVAKALQAAHEEGVVHRDIKPQNILFDGSGQAKVTDFGIARAADSSTITKTGFVMGTAHYLSPEQALGYPASPQSDLYSLGVVLYEMLTGEVPHDAKTPLGIAMKHVNEELRPPNEVNPNVPELLNDVVVRLLAKDPAERYQDAAELIEDFTQMQPEDSPSSLVAAQQQTSSPASTPLSIASDSPAPLPDDETGDAGSWAERYVLEELIGSGGMAEVYLAHDKELDRDVAFKRLRQQYAEDEELIERFRREARNAASLSHPNIVTVHDRGETRDGSYYIVMEYVSGGNLKECILNEGPLPAGEATTITLQVAQALQVAHERGMVHRDVKPQNILLTRSKQAKVADFGIARAAGASTMTKTGSIMGTAHYLSPEQALNNPVSSRSDLYSLGVVLYEMLTGEVPHDAKTPLGIAMKHVNEELRPPNEVNPNVPELLNDVVVRLLAKDPAERYQDAAELIEDFTQIQPEDPPSSVAAQQQTSSLAITPRGAPSRDERSTWPWIPISLALLLLVLLGGTSYALVSGMASEAVVPNLIGASSLEEAQEMTGNDFEVVDGDKVESPEAEGTIVGQNLEAGETAERGSKISVDVAGAQSADLPDVEGASREEAERTLERANMSLGEQTKVASDQASAGQVVEQRPPAGTGAKQGTPVDVVISSDPNQLPAPNVKEAEQPANLPVPSPTPSLRAPGENEVMAEDEVTVEDEIEDEDRGQGRGRGRGRGEG